VVYLKNVDDLFSLFLREKRFLDGGGAPQSAFTQRRGWPSVVTKGEITKSGVKAFILTMIFE
jgi:hypothetical protein